MKPLHQRFGVALLGLLSFEVSATTLYVKVNGTNPTPPYATWKACKPTATEENHKKPPRRSWERNQMGNPGQTLMNSLGA
ncbi:MAG: hypothetical protein WBW41_03165, partial [Verrucomicrobiia bacterium]